MTITTKFQQPYQIGRDVVIKRHNFHARSSLSHTSSGHTEGSGHVTSLPPSRSGSHSDLATLALQRLNLDDHPLTASTGSGTTGGRGRTGLHSSAEGMSSGTLVTPNSAGTSGPTSANASRHGSRANSPERIYYGRNVQDPNFIGAVDEDGTDDVDVDAVVHIPLPITMPPSHSLEPLQVGHKLKWSAYIRNLDGHTSELRCALPILILSPELVAEAQLASSGTRSLLFGPSGVLVPAASGIQQVDLPSYGEHILDRVANIENASSGSAAGGGSYNSSTTAASFARSPWATPIAGPSRSPGHQGGSQARSNGYFTEQNRPINWADSELLDTLSMTLPLSQDPRQMGHIPNSQTSSHGSSPELSRPGSRSVSRPSSRPVSRASSPIRGESTNNQSHEISSDGARVQSSLSSASLSEHPQGPSAQRTSSGFFNMHIPKPLKSLTSFGPGTFHSASSGNLHDTHSSSGSLSSFFHHNARPAGPSSLTSCTQGEVLTAQRSSTIGVRTYSIGPGASHGDVARGVDAALEEHQQQHIQKSKGKGKKKAAVFSSLHADEEDDDDVHHTLDHVSPAHSPQAELGNQTVETGSRYLSQVPSYEIARRGFLGGGVPPLSLSVGLPSYDQSENQSRPTSPHTGDEALPSPMGIGSDSITRSGSR